LDQKESIAEQHSIVAESVDIDSSHTLILAGLNSSDRGHL